MLLEKLIQIVSLIVDLEDNINTDVREEYTAALIAVNRLQISALENELAEAAARFKKTLDAGDLGKIGLL